ncbi:hypothetical protein B484DRAFT_401708 [Ochromonadaceae sp. CCMP2298]|nr:hypothetical protein B484DRAFT_401708 [Ochromonadaceae sp. CCMP2298]
MAGSKKRKAGSASKKGSKGKGGKGGNISFDRVNASLASIGSPAAQPAVVIRRTRDTWDGSVEQAEQAATEETRLARELAAKTFNDTYARWLVKGYTEAIGHNPEMLDDQAREDPCRSAGNRWRDLPFEPGKSAVIERMGIFIPHKRRQGNKQDAARLRARTWFLVPIASAAVSYSVLTGENGRLWPNDPTGIRLALIYNTDELSTNLNPIFQKAQVGCAAGMDAALREAHVGMKHLTGQTAAAEQQSYSTAESTAHTSLTSSATMSQAEAARPPTKPKPISSFTKKGTRTHGDLCAHRTDSIDFTTAGNGFLRHRARQIQAAHKTTALLCKDQAASSSASQEVRAAAATLTINTSFQSSSTDLEAAAIAQELESGVIPRHVYTMDGCGDPLKAMMRFFEDPALMKYFPANSSCYKHWNAGTGVYQQKDVAAGHKVFNSLVLHEKDIIMEGNEAALPYYMEAVHLILLELKFHASLYRTIFKFMANFEHWAHTAMNRHTITDAYRLTGWGPWKLDSWLRRWSGYKKLTAADLSHIGAAFPGLEDAKAMLGDFIEDVQERGLSMLALANLVATAIRKPTYLRPLNQWGAAHLTSSGLLQGRRVAYELREAAALLKEQKAGATTELLALRLATGMLLPKTLNTLQKGARYTPRLSRVLKTRLAACTRALNMDIAQRYLEQHEQGRGHTQGLARLQSAARTQASVFGEPDDFADDPVAGQEEKESP